MKKSIFSALLMTGLMLFSVNTFSQVLVHNNTSCDMWVGAALGSCGSQTGSAAGLVKANSSAYLSQSGSGNLITAEAGLYSCDQTMGSYDDSCSGSSQTGESLTCCSQWQITITGTASAEIN